MSGYRSRSYGDGAYNNDFRAHSGSYTTDDAPPPPLPSLPPPPGMKDWKLKKANRSVGSTSKSWGFDDPEFQRKKRVASYKAYSAQGKVKGSFRKSFRWLKDKYTRVVYGWS